MWNLVGDRVEEINVRIISIFLSLTFLFSSCSFAGDKLLQAQTPETIKDAIEILRPDDPRQAKIELLSWKIKYWQEYLKAIRLEYQGNCYDDRRYRTGKNEIESLTREIRQLLLF